ncbi:MAG: CidA/LrgA family protein [Bacteroides sp.]|nr:CidA/LrgA family protein [Roseburia sp.]MCM1347010.1 CidA/LrgA family protein [Bacteroides sp.]MCM1421529.1 CidA/LrgA family protein [Bacteroides sp.]
MFRQLAIIIGCLAVGEFIIWLTNVPVPSSIIGMLLLTTLLKAGWIKLEWVETLSNFLVKNMGFFFVPPGVALMLYFDLIKKEFLPILISVVASTALVLIVTGWVHQIMRRYWKIKMPHLKKEMKAKEKPMRHKASDPKEYTQETEHEQTI